MLSEAILFRGSWLSYKIRSCGRFLLQRHLSLSSSGEAVVHPHWRGGFFDGDGSVMMCTSGGYTYPAAAVAASISDDNRLCIGAFHNHFGGTLREYHGAALKNAKWRPTYNWRVSGMSAFPVLQELCDSGLCIKKCQAELLLQHQHLFPESRGGRRLSQSVHDARRMLRSDLYAVRALELSRTTAESYRIRLTAACSTHDQLLAYLAGFFDSDGCFTCARKGGRYYYSASLSQKNFPFLEALRSLVLHGLRSTLYTHTSTSVSTLRIDAQKDVRSICSQIRPFIVNKARQVDILLTMRPSVEAKVLLQGMHGNQNQGGRPKQ